MKKYLVTTFILFTSLLYAQQKNAAEVKIKTSSVCETCKETIESNLSFEKGVKSVKLDLKTNVVTVLYNPDKTDEAKIRKALTEIGYDADSLKANEKAFHKLPECCQKPDHHK